MTLSEWRRQAIAALEQQGHVDADFQARSLLQHHLGVSDAHLFTWPEQPLTTPQAAELEASLAQRLAGQPLAWILGHWHFWGLPLKVSPATLIPRADTEILVAEALARCMQPQARVLDLGTGTGAIALALKSERPDWQIDAVDQQPQAVALAQHNAKTLQLDIQVWCSDWWQAVAAAPVYDLIVSNPPYIATDDPHLRQGDLRYEPQTALVAGEDGLDAYRAILEGVSSRLKPGGWLIFEQGYDQAEALCELLTQAGFTQVEWLRDWAGNPRVTLGMWPLEPR